MLLLVIAAFFEASAQDIDVNIQTPWYVVKKVDITSQWQSLDLSIMTNDTVIIMVNGIASTEGANTAPRQFDWIGPEGRGQSIGASWYPMPNVPEQCLLGRIGANGTPFYVGAGLAFTALKSGTLYLGYNDIDFTQNYGIYLATVVRYRIPSMVGVGQTENIPLTFALEQNFPNPFNPSTTIRYSIPEHTFVRLTVYNALGQKMKSLWEGDQSAGTHEAVFEAGGMASGIYYYRLQAGSFTETRSLILVR